MKAIRQIVAGVCVFAVLAALVIGASVWMLLNRRLRRCLSANEDWSLAPDAAGWWRMGCR